MSLPVLAHVRRLDTPTILRNVPTSVPDTSVSNLSPYSNSRLIHIVRYDTVRVGRRELAITLTTELTVGLSRLEFLHSMSHRPHQRKQLGSNHKYITL